MKLMNIHFNIKTIQLVELLLFICFLSIKVASQNNLQNNANKVYNLKTVRTSVYTTAHHTNLKLSVADSLVFREYQQPLETAAAIVVPKL